MFTVCQALDENTHHMIAGSVMKQHFQNIWDMCKEKDPQTHHPYAVLVSKFYGLNGYERSKRDFTEYVLQIRLESV